MAIQPMKGTKMSKLDELAIDQLTKQLSYLKIIVNSNNHEADEIARRLYYIIKDTMEEVDRNQRLKAIEERNRLNGSGYSGKACH